MGKRRVKMDRLRDLFVQMGFADVQTFIASGNVIFEGDTAEHTAIASHLESAMGYEVTTFLRTMDALQTINDYVPFPARTGESEAVRVGFLHETPTQAAIDTLYALNSEIDSFHVNGRQAYWWRKDRASEFTAKKMEKILGMRTTFRNMNTVGRIIKKYG